MQHSWPLAEMPACLLSSQLWTAMLGHCAVPEADILAPCRELSRLGLSAHTAVKLLQ